MAAMGRASPLVQQPALPAAGSDIFGQYDKGVAFASAVILLLAVSAIDKLTGFELRLQILYMIPVAFATWATGRAWGLAMSIASVAIWTAMFATGHNYSANWYHYWDAGVWLASLVIFVLLLARLREEMEWSSDGLLAVLDQIEAPVYVVDAAKRELLYGNARFQAAYGGHAVEALASRAARECKLRWPDGRRALLRILE